MSANDVSGLDRVETWADFTEALRTFHAECGRPKYESISASSGLSKSAISNLIGKNPLRRPSETATVRFVAACLRSTGADQAAVESVTAQWSRTWQRLHRADAAGSDPAAAEAGASAPEAASTRRARRRWLAVAAVGAVAVAATGYAALVLPDDETDPHDTHSGPAAACTHDPASPADGRLSRVWDGVYLCPNDTSPVYHWAHSGSERIGRLRSNPSWFVCWTHGEPFRGSDVWYYTQGDDSLSMRHLDSWGFVPAAHVHAKRHPDRGVGRECPFSTGPA